ncbi:hypothetical protein [Methylovirgula sp. 4M-Z18]|uniref:hypothetical protein n=1 Tax=Methylovirgula sp. 4M-Z18 TaxID=2293567 RepID=UPI0011C080DE|nr:hypothetical protein [Methylovirgula sp. 4M-Z18]
MLRTTVFLVALMAVISVCITGALSILTHQPFNPWFARILFASLVCVGGLMLSASILLEYFVSKPSGGKVLALIAIGGPVAYLVISDLQSGVLFN